MNRTDPAKQVLDERFDAHISRPIARRLARVAFRRGLTADHVSVIAIAFGVSAGVCLGGTGLWPILGGFLLVGMIIIDCVDGEVARLQPPSDKPWRGRMLDGFADLATILSVHIAMVIHLSRTGLTVGGYQLSTLEIVAIAVLGLMSFSMKSSALDDVKHRLKKDSVDHDLERYRDQEKTRFEKLLYWFLVRYVAAAARATGSGRPGGYDTYRQIAIVGPSHHLLAVGVAGMLIPLSPTIYLTYFALTILPGNVYLWAVLARARREAASAEA